jgi:LysR family glycine cleavage system transcriptional activator
VGASACYFAGHDGFWVLERMRRAKALANVRPGASPRLPWLPPLNALHAFEAAGRHLNFRAAAAELCVTPSAISHQIKHLEEQLGFPLFVRTNRALALTSAGNEYVQVVRAAFGSLAAGTSAIRAVANRSIVRVGLVQTLAANWLAPRLAEFAKLHPSIEIQTLTSNDVADVAGGELDLAIRFGQGSWPGLKADRLLGLTLFPVCAPALRKRSPGIRRLDDLAKVPWLHLASYPQAFRAWLTHAGAPELDSSQHFTFDNADVLLRAAEHGMGVAMATQVLVAPYLEGRRLIRPFKTECTVAGAYYLVARADLAREPAVAAVHRWLREAAQPTR